MKKYITILLLSLISLFCAASLAIKNICDKTFICGEIVKHNSLVIKETYYSKDKAKEKDVDKFKEKLSEKYGPSKPTKPYPNIDELILFTYDTGDELIAVEGLYKGKIKLSIYHKENCKEVIIK